MARGLQYFPSSAAMPTFAPVPNSGNSGASLAFSGGYSPRTPPRGGFAFMGEAGPYGPRGMPAYGGPRGGGARGVGRGGVSPLNFLAGGGQQTMGGGNLYSPLAGAALNPYLRAVLGI